MINNWLLNILFFIYPLVILIFHCIISNCIPSRKARKQFLLKSEYVNKLTYLLIPVLVLHLELMMLISGYPFDEISSWVIGILIALQSYLFLSGVIYFLNFFGALKKFRQRMKE